MKKYLRSEFLILALTSVVSVGCSLMQRHPDSGYASTKSIVSPQSNRSSKTSTTTTDQNIMTHSSKSERAKLQNLENSLNTKKEIEQYSKLLPWFKSEQERLDFLSQGNFEQKQKWLNEENFMTRPQQITNEMKELIDAQDITVGMPQSLVKKSWGDPDAVEVSGNPQFKNERWRYNKYVSTNDGYKAEKKSVYFEGGKVVGWEVE